MLVTKIPAAKVKRSCFAMGYSNVTSGNMLDERWKFGQCYAKRRRFKQLCNRVAEFYMGSFWYSLGLSKRSGGAILAWRISNSG
jgi:hypothetical protein